MVRFDFSDRVAIVTGSGGGIGQAYAEALSAAGASVLVADIVEQPAAAVARDIRASGGRAESVRVDVADPASAAAMAEAAVERFGGIDYLVNNAAIFGTMQLDLLVTVDWEYLNRFLSVNLLGALNCVRACWPAMKARGGGAVVNQSSTAAYLYAGFYGLAKAGVNSLTQQLAHELGGDRIRVNAIAPGPIDTSGGPRRLHGTHRRLAGHQAAR
jgi:NAD(P)-dependent dehydrogenase (short-subunit alcohol dehydrogenase family)